MAIIRHDNFMMPKFMSRVDRPRLKLDIGHQLEPGVESGTRGVSPEFARGRVRLD